MTDFKFAAKVAAGMAGLSFLGYCIYFDRKRRSDPLFKQKLKERREKAKKESTKETKMSLPDMKDENAVQKFFLDSVAKGEEYLAINDYENCVKELTQAIAVCGQPQQLLQVFRNTLPPPVFQMLINNLASLGSSQSKLEKSQKPSDDTDGLD